VANGTVLTNAHNLRGAETTVTFADGRSAVATAVGVDDEGDIAVLRVDTGSTPVVAWAEAGTEVPVGTPVFALSTPPGRGTRVTFGLVTAFGQPFRGPRGRRVPGSLEHTAPLHRGSSGGPIVDAAGRLLGINTHREGEGFYLAIPADDELRERVEALSRGESPRRVRLGVALAPPRAARHMRRAVGLPERDGLLVRAVEDGSPAAAAGVLTGDLLVSAGGHPLVDSDSLFDALDAAADAGQLELAVVRGADEHTIVVVFDAPTGTTRV
jgi:serine protease Do